MITGLYSASADSIPILCITGQAPVARLHKEDFQAVDIASIAKPGDQVGGDGPGARAGAGRVPAGLPPDALRPPGPVLIDLPFDVQMAEIDFDPDTYTPLPVYKPAATRAQIDKALDMLLAAERPLIVAGGGIINADAADLLVELAETLNVPVVPTLMGWGAIPDDHPLMAGMVGLQTSHRYGNATMLESDFVLGIGNRWANRHTGGLDVYRRGRTFVHVDIEPTQIGRVFAPDYGIVSDAKAALELFVEVAKERADSHAARLRRLGQGLPAAQAHAAAADPLRQRADQAAAGVRGDEPGVRPRHPLRLHHRAVSQIAGGQFLHVYGPRHWINAGQAGPLGWTLPAALGVGDRADPTPTVVALSGDYDFQFMIEELAVGAQFKLPYIHVLVNNAYLGLIRQSQRGFEMDFHVQLSFDNVNAPRGRTATASTMSRSPKGLAARRSGSSSPTQLPRCLRGGQEADGRVPGAGRRRSDLGAGHQHLDGHRAGQRDRVRGTGAQRRGCADRHLDAGLSGFALICVSCSLPTSSRAA